MDERYTRHEIARYEAVYGRNFVSPGGLDSAREFISRVTLEAGSRVLDVGCGIGGSAFLMARTWQARVEGIDLSGAMIRIANERCREEDLEDRVSFVQGDCLVHPLPAGSYDLIHSRDTFLHIADKAALFRILGRALAPGGRLLFTDYMLGSAPPSEEFRAYVAEHGYALLGRDAYRETLQEAGFTVLAAEDISAAFLTHHQNELARMGHTGLPAEDVHYLQERWQKKISRIEGGQQAWGFFLARA